MRVRIVALVCLAVVGVLLLHDAGQTGGPMEALGPSREVAHEGAGTDLHPGRAEAARDTLRSAGPAATDEGRVVPAATGRIEVTLRASATHEPVGPAVVVIRQGGRRPVSLPVGQDGTATRSGLAHGSYRVELERASLPPGLCSEPGQGSARDVVLSPQEPLAAVVFLLPVGATVHGYVTTASGGPVPRAHVLVQSAEPGREGLSITALSDEAGYYSAACVLLGRYWMRVEIDLASPLADLSVPLQQPFAIAAGAVVRRDVVLGGGSVTVAGRVVDQDGRPFPDLEVLAYYANTPGDGLPRLTWTNRAGRTRTDANGDYTLEHLYPGRVQLQIAPNGYLPSTPVGENLLGIYVPVIALDLVSGSGISAPTRTACRSRPFRISGAVRVDPAWSELSGIDPDDVEVVVLAPSRFGGGVVSVNVRVASDGAFEWACETPQDPITVRARVREFDVAPVEIPVVPVPEETLDLELRFP